MLQAAEIGHLVIAAMSTVTAVDSIDRFVELFPPHRQRQARASLAATLRGVVSQRLLPRAGGRGRVAGGRDPRGERPRARAHRRSTASPSSNEEMTVGELYGMQTFDQSLVHLYRNGLVRTRRRGRARDAAGRDALLPRPRRPRTRTRRSIERLAARRRTVAAAARAAAAGCSYSGSSSRASRPSSNARASSGVRASSTCSNSGPGPVVGRPRCSDRLGRRDRSTAGRRGPRDGRDRLEHGVERQAGSGGLAGRGRGAPVTPARGRGRGGRPRRSRGRARGATPRRAGRAGSTRAAATCGRRECRTARRRRAAGAERDRATPGTRGRRRRTPATAGSSQPSREQVGAPSTGRR